MIAFARVARAGRQSRGWHCRRQRRNVGRRSGWAVRRPAIAPNLFTRSARASSEGRSEMTTSKRLPRRWPIRSLLPCRTAWRTFNRSSPAAKAMLGRDSRDAQPLPGQGVPIFHPGVANFPGVPAQAAGQVVDRVQRRQRRVFRSIGRCVRRRRREGRRVVSSTRKVAGEGENVATRSLSAVCRAAPRPAVMASRPVSVLVLILGPDRLHLPPVWCPAFG